ncbi:MAG: hypothetical protein PHZ02_07720 [Desulfocapsaceae bacterium]|nr:hypothetical protein [Desulfocapsaceae bacterium]
MSNKTLKYLVATVIIMLLVFQVGTLVANFFGMAWGAGSAVVVMAVSFFSALSARSGGKNSFWFLLPALLFIVLPISFKIWKLMSEDLSWFDRGIRFAPFLLGFGAPVILLLVVYYELRKRNIDD